MLDVLVPCSSLFHASVPLWLKSSPTLVAWGRHVFYHRAYN